ncbi:hypothetical protein [Microvirga tunisiensis]|uniref:Uncharacterized protein n=1 Tax=Microvirga tunisiensis TaxID=2108360 RepID=A0A5N7MZU0_9HYPH|nr:hypothetical protein [Microvirga tunisiensis]MPR13532.1 hypothetical protein [Microvirga tunisiensis]MPR31384.1 hypothetical protein [Microvirga tunisiensis]
MATTKAGKKGRGHPRIARGAGKAVSGISSKKAREPQLEIKGSTKHTVVEEARRAGLLKGDQTEHVSFRVPKALLEAAQRETGITSPTELGILALATLAQPDPTAEYLKKSYGVLSKNHKLDI